MHNMESRYVTGPSNILFADVYLSTFQPGNVTGWGSEGVNMKLRRLFVAVEALLYVHKKHTQKPHRRLIRDGRLFFNARSQSTEADPGT